MKQFFYGLDKCSYLNRQFWIAWLNMHTLLKGIYLWRKGIQKGLNTSSNALLNHGMSMGSWTTLPSELVDQVLVQ